MQSVNEIWPVYGILQKKKFHQKILQKTAAWKLVPGPFVFANNEAYLLLVNEIFEANYLY